MAVPVVSVFDYNLYKPHKNKKPNLVTFLSKIQNMSLNHSKSIYIVLKMTKKSLIW